MTIARFRAAFGGVVESLFTQVLVLCAKLGMGKLGVVALDGAKIAANAAKAANRTEEALRKLAAGRVAAHAASDVAKDELFGAGRRGDEAPAEAVDPARRDERIARALAELEAERKAAAPSRAGGPGPGLPGRGDVAAAAGRGAAGRCGGGRCQGAAGADRG